MRPTNETYAELQFAFDYFNAELFNKTLPSCLLTLQRKKRTYGYFSPERFIREKDNTKTDEIAMNPAYFSVVPTIKTMQTVVHEMAHLWQQHFGKPGRGRYHNKEWAGKMKSLGLMPSSTGKPGGKQTGDCMDDYPIEDGPFLKVANKLLSKNFHISWADHVPTVKVDSPEGDGLVVVSIPVEKPTRTKYTCPTCATNVWGKPGLNLVCGDCSENYTPQG